MSVRTYSAYQTTDRATVALVQGLRTMHQAGDVHVGLLHIVHPWKVCNCYHNGLEEVCYGQFVVCTTTINLIFSLFLLF